MAGLDVEHRRRPAPSEGRGEQVAEIGQRRRGPAPALDAGSHHRQHAPPVSKRCRPVAEAGGRRAPPAGTLEPVPTSTSAALPSATSDSERRVFAHRRAPVAARAIRLSARPAQWPSDVFGSSEPHSWDPRSARRPGARGRSGSGSGRRRSAALEQPVRETPADQGGALHLGCCRRSASHAPARTAAVRRSSGSGGRVEEARPSYQARGSAPAPAAPSVPPQTAPLRRPARRRPSPSPPPARPPDARSAKGCSARLLRCDAGVRAPSGIEAPGVVLPPHPRRPPVLRARPLVELRPNLCQSRGLRARARHLGPIERIPAHRVDCAAIETGNSLRPGSPASNRTTGSAGCNTQFMGNHRGTTRSDDAESALRIQDFQPWLLATVSGRKR